MLATLSYRSDAVLRVIRHAADMDAIERLHAAIERDIAASRRRINRARANEEEYLDAVIDDECDHVEEMVGIAFVAAQAFIGRFRTRIAWASNMMLSELGVRLNFVTSPKAYEVLKMARILSASSGESVIEVIHEVANYWKHQEGWPTRDEVRDGRIRVVWNAVGNSKRTIEIVENIGMRYGNSGNIRTAADVLGVTNYADLSPLRKDLQAWAEGLFEKARLQFGQRSGRNA